MDPQSKSSFGENVRKQYYYPKNFGHNNFGSRSIQVTNSKFIGSNSSESPRRLINLSNNTNNNNIKHISSYSTNRLIHDDDANDGDNNEGGKYRSSMKSFMLAASDHGIEPFSSSSSALPSSNHKKSSTNVDANHSATTSIASSQESLLNHSSAPSSSLSSAFSSLSKRKKDRIKYTPFSASGDPLLDGEGTGARIVPASASTTLSTAANLGSTASLDLILENQQLLEWIEQQLDSRGIDPVVYGRYILSLLHSSSSSTEVTTSSSSTSDLLADSSSSSSSSSSTSSSATAPDHDSGYGSITGNTSQKSINKILPTRSASPGSNVNFASIAGGATRYCDFHQRLYPSLNRHQSRTRLLRAEAKALNAQKPSSTTKFMHKRYQPQNGGYHRSGSPSNSSDLFAGGGAVAAAAAAGNEEDAESLHNDTRHCPDCALRNNHDYRKTVVFDCLKDASSDHQDYANIELFVDELVSKFDKIRSYSKPSSETQIANLNSNNSSSSSNRNSSNNNGSGGSAFRYILNDDFSSRTSDVMENLKFNFSPNAKKNFKSFNSSLCNNSTSSSSSHTATNNTSDNSNQNKTTTIFGQFAKQFQHSRSFDQRSDATTQPRNSVSSEWCKEDASTQPPPLPPQPSFFKRNSRPFHPSKTFHRSLSDDASNESFGVFPNSETKKRLDNDQQSSTSSSKDQFGGADHSSSAAAAASTSIKPAAPNSRDQALKYFAAFPALSGKPQFKAPAPASSLASLRSSSSSSSSSASSSITRRPSASSSAKISNQSSLDDSVFGDQFADNQQYDQSTMMTRKSGTTNIAGNTQPHGSWNGLKIIKKASNAALATAAINQAEAGMVSCANSERGGCNTITSASTSDIGGISSSTASVIAAKPPAKLSGKNRVIVAVAAASVPSSLLLLDSTRDSSNFTTLKKKITTASGTTSTATTTTTTTTTSTTSSSATTTTTAAMRKTSSSTTSNSSFDGEDSTTKASSQKVSQTNFSVNASSTAAAIVAREQEKIFNIMPSFLNPLKSSSATGIASTTTTTTTTTTVTTTTTATTAGKSNAQIQSFKYSPHKSSGTNFTSSNSISSATNVVESCPPISMMTSAITTTTTTTSTNNLIYHHHSAEVGSNNRNNSANSSNCNIRNRIVGRAALPLYGGGGGGGTSGTTVNSIATTTTTATSMPAGFIGNQQQQQYEQFTTANTTATVSFGGFLSSSSSFSTSAITTGTATIVSSSPASSAVDLLPSFLRSSTNVSATTTATSSAQANRNNAAACKHRNQQQQQQHQQQHQSASRYDFGVCASSALIVEKSSNYFDNDNNNEYSTAFVAAASTTTTATCVKRSDAFEDDDDDDSAAAVAASSSSSSSSGFAEVSASSIAHNAPIFAKSTHYNIATRQPQQLQQQQQQQQLPKSSSLSSSHRGEIRGGGGGAGGGGGPSSKSSSSSLHQYQAATATPPQPQPQQHHAAGGSIQELKVCYDESTNLTSSATIAAARSSQDQSTLSANQLVTKMMMTTTAAAPPAMVITSRYSADMATSVTASTAAAAAAAAAAASSSSSKQTAPLGFGNHQSSQQHNNSQRNHNIISHSSGDVHGLTRLSALSAAVISNDDGRLLNDYWFNFSNDDDDDDAVVAVAATRLGAITTATTPTSATTQIANTTFAHCDDQNNAKMMLAEVSPNYGHNTESFGVVSHTAAVNKNHANMTTDINESHRDSTSNTMECSNRTTTSANANIHSNNNNGNQPTLVIDNKETLDQLMNSILKQQKQQQQQKVRKHSDAQQQQQQNQATAVPSFPSPPSPPQPVNDLNSSSSFNPNNRSHQANMISCRSSNNEDDHLIRRMLGDSIGQSFASSSKPHNMYHRNIIDNAIDDNTWRPLTTTTTTTAATSSSSSSNTLIDHRSDTARTIGERSGPLIKEKIDFVSFYWNKNCTLGYMDFAENIAEAHCATAVVDHDDDHLRLEADDHRAPSTEAAVQSKATRLPKSYQQYLEEQQAFRKEISMISELFNQSQQQHQQQQQQQQQQSQPPILDDKTDNEYLNNGEPITAAACQLLMSAPFNANGDNDYDDDADDRDDVDIDLRNQKISLINHKSATSAFREIVSSNQSDHDETLHDDLHVNNDRPLMHHTGDDDNDHRRKDLDCGVIGIDHHTSSSSPTQSFVNYFQPIEPDDIELINFADLAWTTPEQQQQQRRQSTQQVCNSNSRSISVSRAELEAYFTPEVSLAASMTATTTTASSAIGSNVANFESFSSSSSSSLQRCHKSNSNCACKTDCNGQFIRSACCCCCPDDYHCRIGGSISPFESKMCDKSTNPSEQTLEIVNSALNRLLNTNTTANNKNNSNTNNSIRSSLAHQPHNQHRLLHQQPQHNSFHNHTHSQNHIHSHLSDHRNKSNDNDRKNSMDSFSNISDNFLSCFDFSTATTTTTATTSGTNILHVDEDELNVTDLVNDVLRLTVTNADESPIFSVQNTMLQPTILAEPPITGTNSEILSTTTSGTNGNTAAGNSTTSAIDDDDDYDGPPMPYSKRKKFRNEKDKVYGRFPISSAQVAELRLLSQKRQLIEHQNRYRYRYHHQQQRNPHHQHHHKTIEANDKFDSANNYTIAAATTASSSAISAETLNGFLSTNINATTTTATTNTMTTDTAGGGDGDCLGGTLDSFDRYSYHRRDRFSRIDNSDISTNAAAALNAGSITGDSAVVHDDDDDDATKPHAFDATDDDGVYYDGMDYSDHYYLDGSQYCYAGAAGSSDIGNAADDIDAGDCGGSLHDGDFSPDDMFGSYGSDPFAVLRAGDSITNIANCAGDKAPVYSMFDLKFKSDNRAIGSTIETVPKQTQKPCTFYMEGFCARGDCKFSHDLSSITCKYWLEGFCIKNDLCPFLHGYTETGSNIKRNLPPVEHSKLDPNAKSFQFKLESDFDFPALAPDDEELDLSGDPPPPPPFATAASSSATAAYSGGGSSSSESLQPFLANGFGNYRINFQTSNKMNKSNAKKNDTGMANGHYYPLQQQQQQQQQQSDEEWPSLNGDRGSTEILNGTMTGAPATSAFSSSSSSSYSIDSMSKPQTRSSIFHERINFREKVSKNKKNKNRFSAERSWNSAAAIGSVGAAAAAGVGSNSGGDSGSLNQSKNCSSSSAAPTAPKFGVTLKGFN